MTLTCKNGLWQLSSGAAYKYEPIFVYIYIHTYIILYIIILHTPMNFPQYIYHK